jgi:indole-3-glycerol phosphate synthase
VSAGLEQIVAATRNKLAETRRLADLRGLERLAEQHNPRGFRRALAARSQSSPAIIAELKKASPSRGLIRTDFDARQLARELELAGASALSVLTDEDFFQGSLQNLRQASAVTKLPCLRKDFVIDEFQLLEARANCADAVLLIVAALSQDELTTLASKAAQLTLDVLCEVHNKDELQRALDAGCKLIGVNNRNLHTFEVDLDVSFSLARLIPANVLSVAESGIHTAADMARLRAAGYRAFLIGESLMKAPSPGEMLQSLLAETHPENAP